MNQDFYHFSWNCPDQTSNVDWGWFGNTIRGDITVLSSGSTRAQMTSPSAGSPNQITVLGNINVQGGQFSSNGSGSYADITVYTYGDINVSAGNFSVARGSGPKVRWHLFGNFSMSDATTQNSNPDSAIFIFNGTGTRTLTLGSGNTLTALPIEVSPGTTLNTGLSVLQGAAKFLLQPGAVLETAHPAGLDGFLQTASSITLSKQAGYGFTGETAQLTGSLLPDSVAELIISNEYGLTLSADVVVNDTVEVRSGTLSPGASALKYGINASLKYAASSQQTTTDAEFPEFGGPAHLILDNIRNLNLHASRTISGNVDLVNGRIDVAAFKLSAGSLSNWSSSKYIRTNGGGALQQFVSSGEVFFPVGSNVFAPLWIINAGAADSVSVGVIRETSAAPFGGRVRNKWDIEKTEDGGGNYTLQFAWIDPSETSEFRNDREGNARIFHLPDTVEAGSGNYSGQFTQSPYTLARAGITVFWVNL